MKKLVIAVASLALFVLIGIGLVLDYVHESDLTAKVISINAQQITHGDENGFSTSYRYIVTTDKGILYIKPDGLLASPQFGAVQEGKIYHFHLRGYTIPIIGFYPNIIEAEEILKY